MTEPLGVTPEILRIVGRRFRHESPADEPRAALADAAGSVPELECGSACARVAERVEDEMRDLDDGLSRFAGGLDAAAEAYENSDELSSEAIRSAGPGTAERRPTPSSWSAGRLPSPDE